MSDDLQLKVGGDIVTVRASRREYDIAEDAIFELRD